VWLSLGTHFWSHGLTYYRVCLAVGKQPPDARDKEVPLSLFPNPLFIEILQSWAWQLPDPTEASWMWYIKAVVGRGDSGGLGGLCPLQRGPANTTIQGFQWAPLFSLHAGDCAPSPFCFWFIFQIGSPAFTQAGLRLWFSHLPVLGCSWDYRCVPLWVCPAQIFCLFKS
jgi:hypothetical protein